MQIFYIFALGNIAKYLINAVMRHCKLYGFRFGKGKHSLLFVHSNPRLKYLYLWQKPFMKLLSLDMFRGSFCGSYMYNFI